jgi:carbamoyltransferase
MNILGLNYFSHDAAAALVQDGKIVAAAEEERFNRKKHTKDFPEQAMAFCLQKGNISRSDLDRIALFIKPSLHYHLFLSTIMSDFPKSIGYAPHALQLLRKRFRMHIPLERAFAQYVLPKVEYVPHHLAHAASAYYPSPFESAAVLTVDGRGESETIGFYDASGNTITKKQSVRFPDSVGYLYSMMTKYLGFKTQNDEYKVMGLSALGTPKFCNDFKDVASVDGAGRLQLNLKYFDHHRRSGVKRTLFSDAFVEKFGPSRDGEPIDQRHADMAYAVQDLTENIMFELAIHARTLSKKKNLCLAGGVALNCLANQRIIESGLFEHVFIQPASSDAGTSAGAALFSFFQNNPHALRENVQDYYSGPAFSDDQIQSALQNYAAPARISYQRIDDPAATAARLIDQEYVIGWFQGSMEFGPRALGNRSILASAKNPEMKDIVNRKIKFRESFRPFAPSVLEERAAKIFDLNQSGEYVYPFMLSTVNVRPEYRSIVPAIVHNDGSARIQTVSQKSNPLYWQLIREYEQLAGVPLVLNTSFNINKEAIVCTPQDALYNFMESGLDYLVMGNYLVKKVGIESR